MQTEEEKCVGKYKRIIPFGRPTRIWEDNINLDLKELDMRVLTV
jgi:hypothetical protein